MENKNKRVRSLVSSDGDLDSSTPLNIETKETKFEKLFNKLNEVSDVLNKLVVTVSDIKTKVNKIEKKVDSHEEILCDLRDKVEINEETMHSIKSEVESSIKVMQSDISSIGTKMQRFEDRVSAAESSLIDQEARSRRDNLLFFGVPESDGENCTKVIEGIISKMNVSTRKNPLQRAHRLGRPKPKNNVGHGRSKPRPIIVKFLDFQDREAVRSARSRLSPPVSISEDFPHEIREARKSLLPQLQELRNKNRRA